MKSSELKILIVGAGIGGLALAIRLKALGFNPTIIEKAKKWKMKGYSLTLWPNGLDVLDKLGVGDEIRKASKKVSGAKIYNSKGKMLGDYSFEDFNKKYKGPYQVYRVDLHRALREKAKDFDIKMGKSVIALKERAKGVDIIFSDNKKAKFDLVVGADGIHSCIRNFIFPNIQPKYLGVAGWLFWIPRQMNFPEHTVIEMGKRKMFALYDHGDERHVVGHFAMIDKYLGEDEPEHRIRFLKQHFGDMKGWAAKVLDHLPHDNESFFHYDHMMITANKWHTKNVALLGDAIHAASPFSAMGASMALEDAFVLADEISKNPDIETALSKYCNRRVPRVRTVLSQANYLEMILKMSWPFNIIRDQVLKKFFVNVYMNKMEQMVKEEI